MRREFLASGGRAQGQREPQRENHVAGRGRRPEKESPEFPLNSKKKAEPVKPCLLESIDFFWFSLIQPLSQLPQGNNREAHQDQGGRSWSL
jgi:hypothetical protein